MLKMTMAGCALGLSAALVFVPHGLTPAQAAENGTEQAAVSGLMAVGTETVTTPLGSTVEITRFMPELRDARINGSAIPETAGQGDEIEIDLRSMVGDFEYDGATG